MKKSIIKDLKKRVFFLKNEKKRKVLKFIYYNINLSPKIRQKALLAINSLPRSSSITRIKNRCVMSGRGRFILSGFRVSRILLRKLAFDGYIPGIRKSSW